MIEFVQKYCISTTATVFVCEVYISLFWPDALLRHDILWQILLLCFVCCLCDFIHPFQETDRKRILFNSGIRYLYINLVVLGGGHIFQWIDIENGMMLAVAMLEILFVTIMVYVMTWKMHKKESERLNRKLQEYRQESRQTYEEFHKELQTKFPVDKP